MKFTDKQYQQLARQADVSEKALRRLLGSIPVELIRALEENETPEVSGAEKKTERFNLGFRLTADTALLVAPAADFVEKLVGSLAEYKRVCPIVYSWLLAGNFDPGKLPERVSRGNVLHAAGTVGRLRAKLLRC